ncbi:LysR family transcriptional regulator [Vibrio campbellii]|uniref:LysR substrate-binding domain-containing protein n=1 Tax=Vibrio campbellii TaxID=680 RepID=A0AAQ3B3A5_9VIBR|nr:LysR substrate-binding domain-containing protein [Vibrio campbellii]AUV87896.1 transcriptional regulator [Vibrio campbellii]AYO12527.1 LysR family transcriptional regulator [Vibrio campbellii]WDG10896.1 LysR substrate-binding domain-containing protein [Vibrio campbellii]
MQNLPPLNSLKAFEATARLQSFTKAAEELNVTRAAVSQQVKSLEAYLDATLFERNGAQLNLTQAAHEYLPVVSHVFQSLSAATQHLFSRQQQAQLTLHVAHSFCSQWLMPRLADFHRQHPKISFKVSTTANAMPSNSDIADVEIINGYGEWQSQKAIQLTRENWIVVASPGFLHLNPVRDLADLIRLPKLATGGYQETWQCWLEQQGYQGTSIKLTGEFEHSLLAIEAAVNQLGVLLVRDLLVEDHLQQGTLVKVGEWSMPSRGAHYMIIRDEEKPHVKAFVDWIMQSL